MLFTGILTYLYFRLKRANKKTIEQADEIGKINEDLKTSLSHQRVLQSEVHHRVKNNLEVIISLLELQADDSDDSELRDNFSSMSNRIHSMAAIHDTLYQKEGTTNVNFNDYANNLCIHFSNFSFAEKKPKFNIAISEHFFNLETSMPLGIILTELLTNSLKYARIPNQILTISVALTKHENEFCLTYKDNGPGFQSGELQEREKGLGTYLLKSMSRQLSGRLETKNNNGAEYKIYFREKIAYRSMG